MKLTCVFVTFVALSGFGAVSATSEVSPFDPADFSSVQTESQPGVTEPVLQPLSNEIDQDQPSGPIYMAAFSQTDLAQSFKQTNDNISGAGILLQAAIGTTDNVTIQVWDALPNAGGTMLAEASTTGTAGNWVDVFWTPVSITPGSTYYLVFSGNTTLGIAGDTANPYPDGWVFANPGFTPFTGYDYAFRTYYETDVNIQRNTWAGVKVFFN